MSQQQLSPSQISSAGASDMAALGPNHAGNVVQTCPKVILEIGVFFDGTGNNEANAQTGGPEGSYANARSNVSLLKDLYYNDEATHDERNACGGWERKYRSLYVQGIGTDEGDEDDLWGSAMGVGERGVENRVIRAALEVGNMIRRLSPGVEPKEIILDVFGFSRGAAAARHFVNGFNAGRLDYHRVSFLDLFGLGGLDDVHAELPADRNVSLRFLGIFDTVAAIMADVTADNWDVNVHLKTGSPQTTFHLTAKDEIRHGFSLNKNTPGGGQTIQLPGVHSNVGGGYPAGFTERPVVIPPDTGIAYFHSSAVSDQAAQMTARRGTMAGDAAVFVSEGYINASDLPGAWEIENGGITSYRVPGPAGVIASYYKWTVNCRMNRPWIRHELSRQALKMMHEKADDSEVPLLALPTSGEYHIPGDMMSASLAEIKRTFTHHSANYNDVYPVIGSPMKERAGRVRREHDNDPGRAK